MEGEICHRLDRRSLNRAGHEVGKAEAYYLKEKKNSKQRKHLSKKLKEKAILLVTINFYCLT